MRRIFFWRDFTSLLHVSSMEAEVNINTCRASVAYELPCCLFRGFSESLTLGSVERKGVDTGAFYMEVLKNVKGKRVTSIEGDQILPLIGNCIITMHPATPASYSTTTLRCPETFPSLHSVPIWLRRTFSCSSKGRQPSKDTAIGL